MHSRPRMRTAKFSGYTRGGGVVGWHVSVKGSSVCLGGVVYLRGV